MKVKCKECKGLVEVSEGYEIQACLIQDHWFMPTVEDVTIGESIEYELNKTIRINTKPLLKMQYYTKAAEGEVSGFGKVRVERDTFVVTDVRIFKQLCTGGHTELDKEALARFVYKLSKRDEDPSIWNLWWHSHGEGSVFFSGTDEATIRKLSKGTILLSICINKDGEMMGRVDRDGRGSRVNVVCIPRGTRKLRERYEREVKKKITNNSWKEMRCDEERIVPSISGWSFSK